MQKMRHGSLFSGIGGFDLAADWMGWENVFHCEWNPFGQRVLHHYWPQAETFTDITKADFTKYYGTIDIITGGFPCQPYSSAGKRLGKEDSRHLWPQMLRAIREISPSYVVGENVRGLTNWNGGLVFDEVCAELESYGYQVAPVIIPASAVGAPHRRERVWFVAYADGADQRNDRGTDNSEAEKIRRENEGNVSREFCSNGNASNANWYGRGCLCGQQPKQPFKAHAKPCNTCGKGNTTNAYGIRLRTESNWFGKSKFNGENSKRNNWKNFPTQSPVCSGDDGLPTELDGITFSKWRAESIKAYGNAIVPQVAYQIFKALELCK